MSLDLNPHDTWPCTPETSKIHELERRVAELEARLAEAEKYNAFNSQYEEYISGEAFNAMEGYIQEKARAEKLEAQNKELRKLVLNLMALKTPMKH